MMQATLCRTRAIASLPRTTQHRRGSLNAVVHTPHQSQTQTALTPELNYQHLCSNMGEVASRPVSGYAGRWSRYQGANLGGVLAEGDIIYAFRSCQTDATAGSDAKESSSSSTTQVWKAEEGDLNSPKLQSQRASLPQLQKDPLQLQLDMDTLVIEVSADAPLLEPSFAGVPVDKLSATMKTLAVPERGNLVVTGALPAIAATQGDSHKGAVDTSAGGSPKKAGNYNNTGGHPEAAKSWFNRMYLRVPGAEPGRSSRWSVMVHYDTATGQLLTHYHTWEAGIADPQSVQDVFTPGAHQQLMQEEQHRHNVIKPVADSAEYIASIKEVASYSCSLLRYSEDGATCTFSSTSNISDDDNSSMVGGGSGGGPETVEVWYDSRCYFRVPASLAGVDATGQQDVVLEVGALLPTNQAPEQLGSSDEDSVSVKQQPGAAGGLLRWRVCYDGGAGHRRLKWAANELWVV